MKNTFCQKLLKFITFAFPIQFTPNLSLKWLEFNENDRYAFINLNQKEYFANSNEFVFENI